MTETDFFKAGELVTPTYGVISNTDGKRVQWHVTEPNGRVCMSVFAEPHTTYTPAKARDLVLAERDRLNNLLQEKHK